jgi:hypothetical protein
MRELEIQGHVNTMSLIENIKVAIQQVVGPSSPEQPIALHEPDFRGTEAWAYVKDCLDTGWVSTAGQWVRRFEQELASATGAAHAVAVTNGTPWRCGWPCTWWGWGPGMRCSCRP